MLTVGGYSELVRRRANTAALAEKLRLVHAVWATQPTIQQLLTARDFPGALELISSSQQLLSSELSGIASLKKLHASLAETKRLITSLMSRDLLQVALGEPDAAEHLLDPVLAVVAAARLERRLELAVRRQRRVAAPGHLRLEVAHTRLERGVLLARRRLPRLRHRRLAPLSLTCFMRAAARLGDAATVSEKTVLPAQVRRRM